MTRITCNKKVVALATDGPYIMKSVKTNKQPSRKTKSMELFQEQIGSPRAMSLEINFEGKDESPVSVLMLPVLVYQNEVDDYVAMSFVISQIGTGRTFKDAQIGLVRSLAAMLKDASEENYLTDLILNRRHTIEELSTDYYWKAFLKAAKVQSDKKARHTKLKSGKASGIFSNSPSFQQYKNPRVALAPAL